ncbi:MAG: amidase, partial [Thermoleophilaceae bacterium]|nr:amidase [Thermoleophilaceae bacterium]
MPDADVLFWPVEDLVAAYRAGEVSPVEVAELSLARIEELDGSLHAFLTTTPEVALRQAHEAERLYRERQLTPPLLGVPVGIKDLFDIERERTTFGSLAFRDNIAENDSEVVARLREAGAVFVGKTNTAEFGQSATTENLLGPPCVNPWDPSRTAGGSSGGSAAGVGAGLVSIALASDGGGSIRIPAAMCGLFGIKPTIDKPAPGDSFHAMTEFVCPGPIARRVADARRFLAAMWRRELPRRSVGQRRRILWCPAPEGHAVDPEVARVTAHAVRRLVEMGNHVEEGELPIDGWKEAFGPLVLADEWRYRRHLLEPHSDELTPYARRSIEAAGSLRDEDVTRAEGLCAELRKRFDDLFARYDLIVTPTLATVSFPNGERPRTIDGREVDGLWGPFPFTAAFNVVGVPAATVPCGLAHGLPVGLQIIGPRSAELEILDLSEDLEEAVAFPRAEMEERWSGASGRSGAGFKLEREGSVAILRLTRPAKRNAITVRTLRGISEAIEREIAGGARAIVLTGGRDVFSAGVDLNEVGNGADDIAVDNAIGDAVAAIRTAPMPVLAAVEGPCVGAAVELALACDIRVAGEGSW